MATVVRSFTTTSAGESLLIEYSRQPDRTEVPLVAPAISNEVKHTVLVCQGPVMDLKFTVFVGHGFAE